MRTSCWIVTHRRKPGCVTRQNLVSIFYYQAPREIKALEALSPSKYLYTNRHLGTINFAFGHSNKNVHHVGGLTGALRIVGRTRCYWRLLIPTLNGSFLSIGDGAMPPDKITLVTPSQPLGVRDRSPMHNQLLSTHYLDTLYWLVSVDKVICARHFVFVCLYRAQASL